MENRRIVLVNPPQGRSQADDYAEKCMNCAHNKMKNTFTEIEKRKHVSVSKLNKEQQNLAMELRKMKKTTGSLARSKATKEFGSSFLESEKSRIRQFADSSRRDGYRSDGASSEDSWDDRSEKSFDDDSVDSMFEDGERTSRKSSRRDSKASYQERSREERLTNIQRRFSAQVNLEVKKSARFPKL